MAVYQGIRFKVKRSGCRDDNPFCFKENADSLIYREPAFFIAFNKNILVFSDITLDLFDKNTREYRFGNIVIKTAV